MSAASLRNSYGQALVTEGSENDNIVVLEADLGKSTMSCLFQDAFPQRYFQMGIAEQNMASAAAGLSLVGKVPFINSFAVFSTGRAYDQIRSSIAIPDLNVKICGSSAGLSDFGDGKTHQSIDDIALMQVLPNMTVLVPVDAVETRKMVKSMVELQGPVYIRISRADLPIITPDNDEPYCVGKMRSVRAGSDCTVFTYGTLVHEAVKAAVRAGEMGISVEIVNVSTIKPLDGEAVKKFTTGRKSIITVDEHSVIGGLGSAIASVLSNTSSRLHMIGIQDSFGTSASNYDDLLNGYGLSEEHILETVVKNCS